MGGGRETRRGRDGGGGGLSPIPAIGGWRWHGRNEIDRGRPPRGETAAGEAKDGGTQFGKKYKAGPRMFGPSTFVTLPHKAPIEYSVMVSKIRTMPMLIAAR